MYLKLCFVTFLTLFYEKHVEEEVAIVARGMACPKLF